MNENFVNVKVDREERPDVDALYMDAAVAINGSGGWPLNLLPDARRASRSGPRPTCRRSRGTACGASGTSSTTVAGAWRDKREELRRSRDSLTEHIRKLQPSRSRSTRPSTRSSIEQAIESLTYSFDWEWGGWGTRAEVPAGAARSSS